ncbi:hypothetical protein BJ912DRAFT_30608 [Pholiota molesta]|nr:hypothetical protein BJ912DRAFT_30608 [Pholiota molesta]
MPTRAIGNQSASVRRCSSCKTRHSPEWRKGPSGQKDLCNACGLRYARSRAQKERSNGAQQRRNKEKTSHMKREPVEPLQLVGNEQKPKDEDSRAAHVDPWDLLARLAAVSSRPPKTPTSSSSSYGSPQSARSRASSWSSSPGGHIPGTSRDVLEFPFGYPTTPI